jgi:hypothetical protein
MAGPSCSTSTTHGNPCDVSKRNLLVAEWRRLNERQLRGGMEGKCVEFRLKDVGSERLSRSKMVALTHLYLTSIPLSAFYALARFESMTILREKEGRLVNGDLEPMRLLIFDRTFELIEQV